MDWYSFGVGVLVGVFVTVAGLALLVFLSAVRMAGVSEPPSPTLPQIYEE